MSKLYDLRQALADAIIAAEIGWTAETILLKRQGDLFNDLATGLATAANGAMLHIGIAEGAANPKHRLSAELTIPLTIVCLPQVEEGATPEEDLWEALVRLVSGLRLPGEEHSYSEFRFKSFSDIEITLDGGTSYLGRQTIFEKLMLF